MNGPSEHLAWSELACHDGTVYPITWRATRAIVLATEFERIRLAIGRPIVIGSAYRTDTWNRKIKGARDSQHVQGRALDLYPPKGWTVDRFYGVIRELAGQKNAIGGVGKYPMFVHFDVRPIANDRLIVWNGSRAWADLKAT